MAKFIYLFIVKMSAINFGDKPAILLNLFND